VIRGYKRPGGGLGARNHIFVLPSVVCSGLAAYSIAGDDAISVPHQHGCAHVGDDSEHTEHVFVGVSANPNVAATVVVGLGCETIQGRRIAGRIRERGQLVEFLGIQAEGGTARTVARGRELVKQLRRAISGQERVSAPLAAMTLGLDSGDAPFVQPLLERAARAGIRVAFADGKAGPELHPDLAADGAQVIVSWCADGEAPVGFAVCPVIAVAGDSAMYEALTDDFDLDGGGAADDVADAIISRAVEIFNGEPSASERRGAQDFLLRRLLRTM
jgi:altronate dehydratase large subunit